MYGYYFIRGDILKIKILKNKNLDLNDTIGNKSLTINKKFYFNIILLLKVIVALIYAFYLGYNLFYFGESFIVYGIKFLVLLFIIYLFIDIPYNFFKVLLIPGAFKKDTVILYINPFNFAIDICFKKETSKAYIILANIISIIIFSFLPNILLAIYGFDIYIYALASASTIFIMKDLFYSILLIITNGNKIISTPCYYKFTK